MADVTAADLSAEDRKILTLARATRARSDAAEGAALRDETGRTYTAGTVSLPSLAISATRLAVAMAAAAGARGLEAVAVVTSGTGDAAVTAADLAAVRDLGGTGVPVYLAGADGVPRGVVRS